MRGPEVDAIRRRSISSQDDFGMLAHYIGRLSATRSSVDGVVRGLREVPALRKMTAIRTIKAPDPLFITLKPEDMIPYQIVRAISEDSKFQNPLHIQSALHTLVDLDFSQAGNDMRNRMKNTTVITRVHAELQIADQFSRYGYKFVDGDKYIGCSKPACYFCYNWLINHKHLYVRPATHGKVIPGCRGPDNDINQSGEIVLKEMYTKMNLQAGQDIIGFLLDENARRGRKLNFMSTEGSSRAVSKIG